MPLDRKSKYGFVNANDEDALRDNLLDESTLYVPRAQLPMPMEQSPVHPGDLSLDMGTDTGASGGEMPPAEPPAEDPPPVVAKPPTPVDQQAVGTSKIRTPTSDLQGAPEGGSPDAESDLSNRQMGMMAGGFEKINAALTGTKASGDAAKPFYDAANNEKALALKAKVNVMDPSADPNSEVSKRAQAAYLQLLPGQLAPELVGKMSATEINKLFAVGGKTADRDLKVNQFGQKIELDHQKLAQAMAIANQKIEQSEKAMANTAARYGGTAIAAYSSKLKDMRPVVSALSSINDIDPQFLRGHVDPGETPWTLLEKIKTNTIPYGAGTNFSDDQKMRLQSAAMMLYQAYIRPLAGANLTAEEQVSMERILRSRMLDNPAAAAAIVDMIRTQKHQELADMEAGVRTQLHETNADHVWDEYVAQGGLSSSDPVFGGDSDPGTQNPNANPTANPMPQIQKQVVEPTMDQLGALMNQPPGSQIRVPPKKHAQAPVQTPAQTPAQSQAPKVTIGTIIKDPKSGKRFRVVDDAGNLEPVL